MIVAKPSKLSWPAIAKLSQYIGDPLGNAIEYIHIIDAFAVLNYN